MAEAPSTGTVAFGSLSLRHGGLFTDLYELTMAAAFLAEEMNEPATFSLFVRCLPAERHFLVAAGLEDVLQYLADVRFDEDALNYLASLNQFDSSFLDYLADLKFSGDVVAVSEGTVVFADEPLLEITAPIIEAQIVETAVLNLCHFQTLCCSKVARTVLAGRGRPIVDFGMRRTHGLDGAMKASRCAYIAGATMSSNVLAGKEYDIPPTGTMAHSFVTAFAHELESFRAFARVFPDNTVLLIDTYDTVEAAHRAVLVANEMRDRGAALAAVRLDSGDLLTLSSQVREILDAAGHLDVRIFASGGLDEHQVDQLLRDGAPIDAFGVGTRMNVSADAPYLDMAYKLVHYAGRDVLKLSSGKETWTAAKQVYRTQSDDGRFEDDLITLRHEPPPSAHAHPLLQPVMSGGRPLRTAPDLDGIRNHCRSQLAALPADTPLTTGKEYPVRYSAELERYQRESALRATRESDPHST